MLSRFLIILSFTILINNTVFAQQEKIEFKKQFGTYQYFVRGERLRLGELGELLRTDKEAYKQFYKAKGNYVLGTILGTAGGFMLGFAIGKAIFSKSDFSVPLVVGGAALSIASLGLNSLYNKQSKRAVDLYNSIKTSGRFRTNYYLKLMPGKVGLFASLN